jgi:hypothetical protein
MLLSEPSLLSCIGQGSTDFRVFRLLNPHRFWLRPSGVGRVDKSKNRISKKSIFLLSCCAPERQTCSAMPLSRHHCQHGVACSGSSQGTARMMSSSWVHHRGPTKPTTKDYIASSREALNVLIRVPARANRRTVATGGPLATRMKQY